MQLEYVDVVFANRPDSNTPMEGEEDELGSSEVRPRQSHHVWRHGDMT